MTRELLELAASAAGIKISTTHQSRRDASGCGHVGLWTTDGHTCWNPLKNDGDALQLAISIGLSIEPYPYYSSPKHSVIVKQRRRGDQMRESNPTEVVEVYGDDAAAATRRAIVRAAAAVAQANPIPLPRCTCKSAAGPDYCEVHTR